MYLTEILSEWILSQWIFLMWMSSQLILSNWEDIVFGSLPWIIALLGVFSAFFGPYYLWKQQQKKELRTLANAFIIDLERIYNTNFPAYSTFKNNPETMIFCPDDKFYDHNGAYFLFIHEIYKFDYELSSKILVFYDNLLLAESSRESIIACYKNIDHEKFFDAKISFLVMKSNFISTEEQIINLRNQLKKVRGE